MAVKSITLKHKKIMQNGCLRRLALQLDAGNYVQIANGGLTVDFTTMLNPQKIQHGKFGGVAQSPSSIPASDDISCPSDVNGYSFLVQQAAANPTLKNYTLTIYGSGGSELAAGAMPAGLQSTDIIVDVITPLKRE